VLKKYEVVEFTNYYENYELNSGSVSIIGVKLPELPVFFYDK